MNAKKAASSAKKAATFAVKLTLMVAILGFLFYQASENDAFGKLQRQSKNWWLLGAALGVCAAAVTTTLLRWHLLLRAVGIRCSVTEALRIGYVGFLFNLVPAGGIVAGDVVKAVMMARRHENQYAKTLASAFVDRVLGLYVLFVVGLVSIYLTGFHHIDNRYVHIAHYTMWVLVGTGTLGIIAVAIPDISRGATLRQIARLPQIGPKLCTLIESVQLYRHRGGTLLVASVMSAAVHCFLAFAVYLIASGLYDVHPTLQHHFVVCPISFTTGAIPLAAGPFEMVLDRLYTSVPAIGPDGMLATPIGTGQGFVIAICYRLISLVIALVGVVYYLASRAEMHEVLEEAQHKVEEDEPCCGERFPSTGDGLSPEPAMSDDASF